MTKSCDETARKGGPKKLRALLAAAQVASLRANTTFQSSEIEVDAEAGILRNVSIITIGPAEGHGFDIDATTLEQVAELINAAPDGNGVESRFTHPQTTPDGDQADALGTKVGRVKNARVVGSSVRGDVHLGDYAKILPGLGDVRSYLLAIAKEDPALIGLSTVIAFSVDPVTDTYGEVVCRPARVSQVQAVDFVGRPAANPSGLLSAQSPALPIDKPPTQEPKRPASAPAAVTLSTKGKQVNEELKKLLVGAGLDANATDDEAQSFYDGLAADVKTKIDSDCAKAKMAAKVPAAANLAAKPDHEDEFVALEAKRVNRIKSLAATIKTGVPAQDAAIEHARLSAIADNLTVAQAQTVMLKAMKDALSPVVGAISVAADQAVTSLTEAIPQAIMLRAFSRSGITRAQVEKHEKIHERALQLQHLSFSGMFKAYLKALGATGIEDWSPVQCANAMGPRGMRRAFPKLASLAESTSDFSNITADVFNKSLRYMYLDAPRTWDKWAARGTAPDFKNINRVVLSESPDLVKRTEGGELKYVTLTDSKETYALAEYVAGIKLTRRVIINDDLSAFVQIPRQQANAAARKEDDVAYAILTANAAMADTGLLFNSTAVTTAGGHANYTSSGTALSISSLQVGKTQMKKQKGLANAARLELNPKFLLVPTSIEETTIQLIGSDKVFPVTGATPNPMGINNPFFNRYEVIGSTRLDDASSTAWYLVADYRTGQVNTVEVAFLEDEPEPVMRQETDFDSEDVKYAIRHTVAAAALDFRGMYKNVGA